MLRPSKAPMLICAAFMGIGIKGIYIETLAGNWLPNALMALAFFVLGIIAAERYDKQFEKWVKGGKP